MRGAEIVHNPIVEEEIHHFFILQKCYLSLKNFKKKIFMRGFEHRFEHMLHHQYGALATVPHRPVDSIPCKRTLSRRDW